MEKEKFLTVSNTIEGFKDEIIDMQKQLTALKALAPENGGEGEYQKAEYLKKQLKSLNPAKIIEINAPDDRVPNKYRPNFVAFFNGESSEKTIWIMSHIDVVPPGDLNLWHTDPFKVEFKNDRLYGRGVEDNQQSLVASYMAVKALQENNISPSYRVALLMVSDEETGNKKGLQYVMDQRKNLFSKNDLFLVPDGGNSDGTMIEIAEKSMLWLKLHTLGKQSHASRPDLGINSFKAEGHLITKLHTLYEIFNEKDLLYDVPTNTFEPTKKEANVPNINTIPGEDVFYLDSRILPEVDINSVIAYVKSLGDEVEKQFKVKVTVSTVYRADAAPPTSITAPVVESLKKGIYSVTNKEAKPMGIGGGTVAAILRKEGFDAAVWATLDETAHQPNEYCILKNLINDSKIFAHLLLQK